MTWSPAVMTLLAAMSAPTSAATVATLEEMTLSADLIVLGNEVRVHPVDALKLIEVAPKRTVKGIVDGKRLFYLAPAGGSYGVEPAFVGETVLLFLKKAQPPPGYSRQIAAVAGESPFFNVVLQTGRLPSVGAIDGDEVFSVHKNVIVLPEEVRPVDWSNPKVPSPTVHFALKPAVAYIEKVLKTAAAAPVPGKPGLARRLSLNHAVATEWECGKKCIVTREGASKVTVTPGEGSALRVTDAGMLMARTRSPGTDDEESKNWEIVYRGTWYGEGAPAAAIDLLVESNKCNESRPGTGVGVKCGKTPERIMLRCLIEKVPVLPKRPLAPPRDAGAPTEAWVCRPEFDMSSYAGTPLPWVFGPGGRVSTLVMGGLKPETYHHFDE